MLTAAGGLQVDAEEGGEDAAGGQQAGIDSQELGVSGGQGDNGLGLHAQARQVQVERQAGQPGQDVVQVVQRNRGAQLPPQLVEHQQLPVL